MNKLVDKSVASRAIKAIKYTHSKGKAKHQSIASKIKKHTKRKDERDQTLTALGKI